MHRVKINHFSESFLWLRDKWRLPLTWSVSESKIALAEISSKSFPSWKWALLMSIIFLLYPGASVVFQHLTILSTSVLQFDVAQVSYQVIYLSNTLLLYSNLFTDKLTFFRRTKGGEFFERHCVCLPWCLLTWQYLSMDFIHRFISVSLSTEIGFYFYPQDSYKAACQVRNTKWAKVFKLRIWSWSLISSYMTKRSRNFGWFILKRCMLSHFLPEMSSVGIADLDENSP